MAFDSTIPSQADGTPAPATFEGLPIELRRKIYSNLLISDKVRQPPNEHLIRYYHFDTAILRVNKKIYLEASHMLYNENTFITVSCDWDMISTVMKNHEVAVLCDKPKLVARFKKHIMRVHIKFSWSRTWKATQNKPTNNNSGNVLESFLILADELPKFTRMLHIMNVTNGGDRQKSKYLFRMESTSNGTPSLSVQKSLLEPFRHLYTWAGCVKFTNVDAAYAEDLGKTMMPPVQWVRNAAWRLYNVCVSIKEVGDFAFRTGNYDQAFAKYEDAQQVYKTGVHNNERIGDVEDEGFHTACDRLLMTCETNILLACLNSISDPKENMTASDAANFILKTIPLADLESQTRSTPLSNDQKSRLYHYRGIALSLKNNDKSAFNHLKIASQLDPADEGIKGDMLIAKGRSFAKTAASKAAAGAIDPSCLADEPLALEPPKYTKSEFINGERFLLPKYGYQGDMLEHIEGSKPVDMKEMDRIQKMLDQQLAQAKSQKADTSIMWIGGGGKPDCDRPHGVGLAINPATHAMQTLMF